jgi:hypothetical protein
VACSALLALLLSLQLSADEVPTTLTDRYGFSGFPGLPSADILPVGALRVTGALDYGETEAGSGILSLPLRGCWGALEDLEVCAGLPVYLDDDGMEGGAVGNISLGASYLYERARGGTNLLLRTRASLPTGSEARDGGARLETGVTTGTTFRLLRLSATGMYGLASGNDPFEDDVEDYMRFVVGGSSFVAAGLQLAGSMEGSTGGDLTASAFAAYDLGRELALHGGVRAGLDGPWRYRLAAGATWTGLGF